LVVVFLQQANCAVQNIICSTVASNIAQVPAQPGSGRINCERLVAAPPGNRCHIDTPVFRYQKWGDSMEHEDQSPRFRGLI
jgi:hypothetical protein